MVFESSHRNKGLNATEVESEGQLSENLTSQGDTFKAQLVKGLDLKFKLPFRALLQGATGAGKSSLILNIVKQYDKFFNKKFQNIAYFYPINGLTESRRKYIEELREYLGHLEIQEGLPNINDVLKAEGETLLFIEDLYFEASNSYDFLQLVIHGSHHANTSFFITTQNLYFQGKYQKTLMRNYSDFILFGGFSDYQVLKFLSRQLFDDKDFLANCMKWLKKNFKHQYERYLWIHLHLQNNSEHEDQFRVRANFLKTPIIFQSKNVS